MNMSVILLGLAIFLQRQIEFIVNNCVNHCSSNFKITVIFLQNGRFINVEIVPTDS